MKAAILEKLNSPLIIADLECLPLEYGQVKVKIVVSGLCGAQLQEIAGEKGNAKFLPHLMGHEGCGIVEEIGPGVSRVKIGDKVVMHWRVGAGIDAPNPKYRLTSNGNIISGGKVTTLSEYSVVSENRLTVVPQDTDNYLCALLGCCLTTALGTINNEAKVKFGESVLILGCGGVGLALIQAAKMASAYPIIGLDLNAAKRQIVMNNGATHYINTHSMDFPTDQKFDVIIDTTGNNELITKSINLLSDSGRFILVAQPKSGSIMTIEEPKRLFKGNGSIIQATQGGNSNPNEDINRYIKLMKSGYLKINNLITHKNKLEDINSSIDLLKTGLVGRIMIDME